VILRQLGSSRKQTKIPIPLTIPILIPRQADYGAWGLGFGVYFKKYVFSPVVFKVSFTRSTSRCWWTTPKTQTPNHKPRLPTRNQLQIGIIKMSDPAQPKLNEFYMLHTHPAKVFKRIKGVKIDEIVVKKYSNVLHYQSIPKKKISITLQSGIRPPFLKEVDLVTKKIISQSCRELFCSKCAINTTFVSLRRRGPLIVSLENCMNCGVIVAIHEDSKTSILFNNPKKFKGQNLWSSRSTIAYLTSPSTLNLHSWSSMLSGDLAKIPLPMGPPVLGMAILSLAFHGQGALVLYDDNWLAAPWLTAAERLPLKPSEYAFTVVRLARGRIAISGVDAYHKKVSRETWLRHEVWLFDCQLRLRGTTHVDFWKQTLHFADRAALRAFDEPMMLHAIGKRVLALVLQDAVLTMLQVRRGRLQVVCTGKRLIDDDYDRVTCFSHVDASDLVFGTMMGRIAVAKLTFH
jgi:hypothetical protein